MTGSRPHEHFISYLELFERGLGLSLPRVELGTFQDQNGALLIVTWKQREVPMHWLTHSGLVGLQAIACAHIWLTSFSKFSCTELKPNQYWSGPELSAHRCEQQSTWKSGQNTPRSGTKKCYVRLSTSDSRMNSSVCSPRSRRDILAPKMLVECNLIGWVKAKFQLNEGWKKSGDFCCIPYVLSFPPSDQEARKRNDKSHADRSASFSICQKLFGFFHFHPLEGKRKLFWTFLGPQDISQTC